MNRRHFFALSLPVLLGGAVSAVSAETQPASKPSNRRVKMEVSHTKTGDSNNQTIVVTTDADVETYVAFVQTHVSSETVDKSNSQVVGPYLRVTPHIEADGKILVNAESQFGDTDIKMTATGRVESGKKSILAVSAFGDVEEKFYLTATLLDPHQNV